MGDDLRLALFLGEGLPEPWRRVHYRGDKHPHIERRWGPPDPDQPHHVQRRVHAEVQHDGRWMLTLGDGPTQYYGYERGEAGTVAAGIEAATTAAEALMAEPVAYPRQLVDPQTGRRL